LEVTEAFFTKISFTKLEVKSLLELSDQIDNSEGIQFQPTGKEWRPRLNPGRGQRRSELLDNHLPDAVHELVKTTQGFSSSVPRDQRV
jgi:hypothetical protein